MKTLIIAEAGVNHNGSLDLAKQLADKAMQCGADIIKYQTFISENLISRFAPKAQYQAGNTDSLESQLEMCRKLELSQTDFLELKQYCDHIGITFLSTPFDLDSFAFLNALGLPYWKIPSGEITNLPYLLAIAATGKPTILSTGMSNPEEIGAALDILQRNGAGEIMLLHCTTEYPAPMADINLQAMVAMREMFGVQVGYSDHSQGIHVPIAAIALGACIIEKHFTLDRTMEGPDHKASLEPEALAMMVASIRDIEIALGDGVKRPMPSEIPNIVVARKSIVARESIRAGEVFTERNITVKRPGDGISPMRWFEVLGKTAIKDFARDELIKL